MKALRVPLLLWLVAVAWQAPPVSATHQGTIHTANGKSAAIYSQSVLEHYRVPTDWGTIYGAVRRPVVPEGVKVPVILTYSPYNITARPTNGSGITDSIANFYVPRGYARALFDVVGTRESGGCYDFGGIAERETGAAVVDFLGTRPWSNGKVGMVGGSYDGTTQYAVAVEAPEHLTTIVPQVAIDRWYDYPYEGGVRRFSGFGTPLLFDFGYGFVPPTDVAGDPVGWAQAAVAHAHPCERVTNQVRGFGYDPVYDDFWVERDYRALADRVTASVMIEGGWLDSNVQPIGSTRFFQALPDDHPKRLVIGQWGHAVASFTDSNRVRHAWFDHWLLGLDTGVMNLPRVDSHGTGGPRVQEHHWPPILTREATLPLVASGAASGAELALSSASTTWTDDDLLLGESQMMGDCDDACVAFVGAPLGQQIRISGTPFVDLEMSAAAPASGPPPFNTVSTQVAVVLFMDEAGSRTAITRGMLNFRNRAGLDRSEDAISGRRYALTVELDDTDYWVPAGARLGIAVASQNSDATLLPDDDTGATNTLHLDGSLTEPALRLPVGRGHLALGLPDPCLEEELKHEQGCPPVP